MSIIGAFILTTAIGINVTRNPASEEQDAYKALIKATYIQTGTDKQVKLLEKKYIPPHLKKYGGVISGLSKVILDKKISMEWTF